MQYHYCKKLLRTTKKRYFNNLDTKKVTDNRAFYETAVLLFQVKLE